MLETSLELPPDGHRIWARKHLHDGFLLAQAPRICRELTHFFGKVQLERFGLPQQELLTPAHHRSLCHRLSTLLDHQVPA